MDKERMLYTDELIQFMIYARQYLWEHKKDLIDPYQSQMSLYNLRYRNNTYVFDDDRKKLMERLVNFPHYALASMKPYLREHHVAVDEIIPEQMISAITFILNEIIA